MYHLQKMQISCANYHYPLPINFMAAYQPKEGIAIRIISSNVYKYSLIKRNEINITYCSFYLHSGSFKCFVFIWGVLCTLVLYPFPKLYGNKIKNWMSNCNDSCSRSIWCFSTLSQIFRIVCWNFKQSLARRNMTESWQKKL